MAAELQVNFLHPRFSPDSNSLVLNYCLSEGRNLDCRLGIYDLTARSLRLVPKPENESWVGASFSPDGRQVVFVSSINVSEEQSHHGQISIVDLDGTSYRKITNSPTPKNSPSFSQDGTKIIYARYNKLLPPRDTISAAGPRRGYRPIDGDIYEVGIDGGEETRLTHYEFSIIGKPYYFPDGRRFIFHAEAPAGASLDEFRAYMKKYSRHNIYVMERGISVSTNKLQPAILFESGASYPSVSRDGKILFVAGVEEMDAIQKKMSRRHSIFIRIDEKNSRIIHPGTNLYDAVISPDGRKIAYLSDIKKDRQSQLFVMNSDGTGIEEIVVSIVSPLKH